MAYFTNAYIRHSALVTSKEVIILYNIVTKEFRCINMFAHTDILFRV